MAIRTNEERVRAIVDSTTDIDMIPFIRTASLIVDKVSSNDSGSLLGASDLLEIESYLSAHFYAHRDQLLTSKSTGGASGSFQGQTGLYFEATLYGQTALLLDITGYLSGLMAMAKEGRRKVLVSWLGSTESEGDNYTSIYDELP